MLSGRAKERVLRWVDYASKFGGFASHWLLQLLGETRVIKFLLQSLYVRRGSVGDPKIFADIGRHHIYIGAML